MQKCITWLRDKPEPLPRWCELLCFMAGGLGYATSHWLLGWL